MGSPMASSDLTLRDLERSNSRSPRYRTLISHKRAELRPMLLLIINRKPYMGSPIVPSHLTLRDLERSKSRSLRFWSLISQKGAQLDPMLQLKINRKPYIGSVMVPVDLTLSDPERSFRYWTIEDKYSVNIYFLAVFDINLDVTFRSLLAAGFSPVPAVVLVADCLRSHVTLPLETCITFPASAAPVLRKDDPSKKSPEAKAGEA